MPKSPMLTGEDRVEHSPLLGRTIRSGALSQLKVPDQERCIELIRLNRTDEALTLLDVLRPLYLDMNRILLEWSLSWGQTVREVFAAAEGEKAGTDAETLLSRRIHQVWSDIILSEKEFPQQTVAAPLLATELSAEKRLGRADCTAISEKLNAVPLQAWQDVVALVKEKKVAESITQFQDFVLKSRAVHDFLCQYLWVAGTETEKMHGQAFSERINMESFQSCTMYEGFFKVIVKLTPEGLVALMAEHLRGHFSGPGRSGKVEIIESDDTYRIVFDGCGSGGAMRRKVAANPRCGLENYPEASHSTWNMKNVSAFCAHCAQNEMFMIQKFGFPCWVVNYDADPMKPCSWTIYKDYTKVPQHLYERVGFKKDPSKFVELPKD